MQGFIEEVVRSGCDCERDQVMNLYQTNPELERYFDCSALEALASRTLLREWDLGSIQDALETVGSRSSMER